MSFDSGVFKEFKQNFILDEGKLRKIAEVLQTYAEKKTDTPHIEFTVYRIDNSYYETESVDEVLSDDNGAGKEISALIVDLVKPKDKETPKKDQSRLCRLRFRTGADIKIDFSISDPDRDWCFLLADDIETQIRRVIRPRRLTWLRQSIFLDMASMMLLLNIIAGVFIITSYLRTPSPDVAQIAKLSIDEKLTKLILKGSPDYTAIIFLALYMIGTALAMMIAEARPISKLLSWFDRSVFYWGDRIEAFDGRSATIQKVKWGVIIAFLVSVAASVIVAFALPK
ncbi:MAG: hypothetical protein ABFD76_10165 [Smithella sp.]